MGLDYKKEGKIRIFTINRPEVMNALDAQTFRELNAAFAEFCNDNDAWVGILTGAGEKSFSAGVDLKKVGSSPAEKPPGFVMTHEFTFKPLIAAINGYCLGAGMELALACDIRLAAEHARLGTPEVTRGLTPREGATQRLPRTLAWCHAAEMLFLGQPVDAQEAYRIGLVNRVVPLPELMPTALKWAELMCQSAPLALRVVKEAMVRGASLPLKEGLALEREMGEFLNGTEDYREGRRAFAEGRKPNYQGR